MNYVLFLLFSGIFYCSSLDTFNIYKELNAETTILQKIHRQLDNDCVLYASNLDYAFDSNKILRSSWKKIMYVEYSPLHDKFKLNRYGHVFLVWKHKNINSLFVSDENGTFDIICDKDQPLEVAKKVMNNSIIYKAAYIE